MSLEPDKIQEWFGAVIRAFRAQYDCQREFLMIYHHAGNSIWRREPSSYTMTPARRFESYRISLAENQYGFGMPLISMKIAQIHFHLLAKFVYVLFST